MVPYFRSLLPDIHILPWNAIYCFVDRYLDFLFQTNGLLHFEHDFLMYIGILEYKKKLFYIWFILLYSSKHILGHPVLMSPVKRQAMYRPMCSTKMTPKQRKILNKKVPVTINWNLLAKSDKILESILNKNGWGFSFDATGACHLGRIISCHYTQHMRDTDKVNSDPFSSTWLAM